MTYKIIASSSKGNCVIYHNSIVVDMGVNFSMIEPFLSDMQIILLTHEHHDHLNIASIKKIQLERPSIRVTCGEWMLPFLEGVRNIDVLEAGKTYDYVAFKIIPITLYHDVQNFGYRIFKDDYKIIHCTDTCHLEGITASNYNLYALEHNYDEDTVYDKIEAIEAEGGFAYQRWAINSHLSEQQARSFFYKNKGENSKLIRLHESSIFN